MKKLFSLLKIITLARSKHNSPSHAAQQLEIKQQLKDIAIFIKKLTRSGKIDLNNLKTHLLIGPYQSGKTTLLANSDLKYVLEKKIKSYNAMPSTKSFEWWLTKQTLFIDTPSYYFGASSNKIQKNRQIFLKTLKKSHLGKTLQNIIIVLSVKDLIHPDKEKRNNLYSNIKKHLAEIEQYFGNHFSLFIIVNKCDQITGFREFFDDLSQDERWQIWGIPIKRTQIIKEFTTNFNILIRRLNDQMIWHLHHEINPNKHALINDFPAQMAHLKEHLDAFLQNALDLQKGAHKRLGGIFFTSATQHNLSYNDFDATTISSGTQLIYTPQTNHKGYFIHKLFNEYISMPLLKNKPSRWAAWLNKRFILYSSTAALIIFSILFSTFTLKTQFEHLYATQKTLTTYQYLLDSAPKQKMPLSTKLEILDTLQSALQNLAQKNNFLILLPAYAQQNKKLQQKITLLYNKDLQTFLYPYIIQSLTANLANTALSPDATYATLKSYLMLNQPAKLDISYIANVLQNIWGQHHSSQETFQLVSHTLNLLSDYPPPLNINSNLVRQTQQRLNKLNNEELAYIILLNHINNNQLLTLNLNQNFTAASIFTFANDNLNIPNIYTAQNSLLKDPSIFTLAAKEALMGNWIIGNRQADPLDIKELAKKLFQRYASNYANTWINFLNNIRIINFTDLATLDQTLQLLISNNSPLTQLIQLAKNNLSPEIVAGNNDLAAIINLNNQQMLANIQQALLNLHTYLASINSASNSDQQAFELASKRIRADGDGQDPIEQILTMATQYPEPIKSWLYDIGMNAWQLMLYQTQNYIETTWKNDIFPQYLNQIAGQFPFDLNANKEVNLDNFCYFFAPNGLLDNFISHYLSAFIKIDQFPWQLKNLDGNSLQISTTALVNLQRAYQIQKVYFPGHDEHLIIPFKIQPINIEANITQLAITLGSQKFSYKNNTNLSQETLVWPDYTNPNLADITFTANDNNQTNLQATGPWAWFKLLQHGNLHPTITPHKYLVTFAKAGYAAQVSLFIKQPQNPFSLKWFQDFSLPNEL